MEQLISYGVKSTVDNIVLQHIIKLVDATRIGNEKIAEIVLSKCDNCIKQYIRLDMPEQDINELDSQCVICAAPVDDKVLVYRFKDKDGTDTQLFCLESEAEALCS